MNFVIAGFLALFFATQAAFGISPPASTDAIQFGYGLNSAVAAKIVPRSSMGNTFALIMSTTSGTNTGYYKFVKAGSIASTAVAYSVTTAKTAYCSGYYSAVPSAANFNFGYGTAAVGSEGTTTPPTGAKQLAATGIVHLGTANVFSWYPIPYAFPADSYPYVYGTSINALNMAVVLICEER